MNSGSRTAISAAMAMAAPGLFWKGEEKLDPMPGCPRIKGLKGPRSRASGDETTPQIMAKTSGPLITARRPDSWPGAAGRSDSYPPNTWI